jgi:hypothetical protein
MSEYSIGLQLIENNFQIISDNPLKNSLKDVKLQNSKDLFTEALQLLLNKQNNFEPHTYYEIYLKMNYLKMIILIPDSKTSLFS